MRQKGTQKSLPIPVDKGNVPPKNIQRSDGMTEYRTVKDSMGEVRVPADALYGATTQRAVDNFPISGIRFSRTFLRALGLIKAAAGQANADLGLLDAEMSGPIQQA